MAPQSRIQADASPRWADALPVELWYEIIPHLEDPTDPDKTYEDFRNVKNTCKKLEKIVLDGQNRRAFANALREVCWQKLNGKEPSLYKTEITRYLSLRDLYYHPSFNKISKSLTARGKNLVQDYLDQLNVISEDFPNENCEDFKKNYKNFLDLYKKLNFKSHKHKVIYAADMVNLPIRTACFMYIVSIAFGHDCANVPYTEEDTKKSNKLYNSSGVVGYGAIAAAGATRNCARRLYRSLRDTARKTAKK